MNQGKGTVLVVDDEANTREFVGTFLSQEGYEVIVASDGEQGLQAMEEALLDLVILANAILSQDQ